MTPAETLQQIDGKAGFAERLEGLAEDFVYRSFTPLDILDGGDEAAAQVEIEMTHKATGRDFRMRGAQFRPRKRSIVRRSGQA